MNMVIVRGRLSSSPRVLDLESGDRLVRYEVTVARDGSPAESVPVSWVGPPRRSPAAGLDAGDEVVAVGRIRRRWYRPGGGPSQSRTEVAADAVVPARHAKRVDAALRPAREALAAFLVGEGSQ